jgi:hypothetical protein
MSTANRWIERSTDAVNFSSARTTKRFPSSRCAFAIQIVRPLESIAETQPKLQPAFLRLSAALLIVADHLRRRFARFNLGAHFLDLRCLLVETRSKLRNRCAEVFL